MALFIDCQVFEMFRMYVYDYMIMFFQGTFTGKKAWMVRGRGKTITCKRH